MLRIDWKIVRNALVLSLLLLSGGLSAVVFADEKTTAKQTTVPTSAGAELTPAKIGDLLVARNGEQARRNAVLSVPVEYVGKEAVVMEVTDAGEQPVPSSIDDRIPARLWWRAPGDFAAQTTRTFRFVERPSHVRSAAIGDGRLKLERNVHSLLLYHSPMRRGTGLQPPPWLQYHHAHVTPPAEIPPIYGRSAYLHPLRTPSGRVVTDEYPPDHAHQSGVFLAYTKARFEGREPNFWELANKRGRVRFKSVIDYYDADPLWVEFEVEHEHVDETAEGGLGKVALLETWIVRMWNPPLKQPDHWVFDIETRRRCATNQPLQLPQYHYGGMALRGARGWGGEKGRFTTSEGKDRVAGNHTRPRWCDLSGEVDGKTAGLALLTHPANFRYPEPLRIHPSMPYMVYTPSQLGDWEIAPGVEQISRYRFVVHDGATPVSVIEDAWIEFAEPIKVVVKSSNQGAP